MTDAIENQDTQSETPGVAAPSGLNINQLHDAIVGLLNGSPAQDALNVILAIVPKCIQSMSSQLLEPPLLEVLDFKIKSMYFDSSKTIFDRYRYLCDRNHRLELAKQEAIQSIVKEAIQAVDLQESIAPDQTPTEVVQEETQETVST